MDYERIILQEEPGYIEIDWEGKGYYLCVPQYDSIGEFKRFIKDDRGDYYESPEEIKSLF